MPFFFAWVANGDTTFDPDVHNVEDEDIFAFEVSADEGQFALLDLTIRNPRVGLLNDDRDQWAWFSWQAPGSSTITPLFHGRLIAIPQDLDKELVTISFHGRPPDLEAQKETVAEALRVAPYWDPIWFSDEDRLKPDTVLEGTSRLWHFGRVDKTVSVTDVVVGEDGAVTFDESTDDIFDLQVTPEDRPIESVQVEATVQWKQSGRGEVDLHAKALEAFADAGSSAGLISSFTGKGLEFDWPTPGSMSRAGWSVGRSDLVLMSGDGVTPTFVEAQLIPAAEEGGESTGTINPDDRFRVYLWVFGLREFTMVYSGQRERVEKLSFTLTADLQSISNETDDVTPEILTFSSSNVALPVDAGGVLPIGDVRRNSYFNIDRGRRSIDWLLAAAAARIRRSARAVTVSAGIRFEEAIALSLRKNATIVSNKLPGGTATGKITRYKFGMTEPGALRGSVSIGCSVGRGGSLPSPADGSGVYAEDGYMQPGYQQMEGVVYTPIPELSYPDYRVTVVDDGLPFENLNANNVIDGLRASQLFTLSGVPTADETVTIGATVYTWKVTPAAAYDVLIGESPELSINNLIAAVNARDELSGILFGLETLAHPDVAASTGSTDNIMRVRARVGGEEANSISVSDTVADGSWGGATLSGGTPLGTGFIVLNGEDDQRALLTGTVYSSPADVEAALDDEETGYTRVQLYMRPITGGPFETIFVVEPSALVVPKTIDLEAEAL